MKYEFHPEAELELYKAALRYEAEVPELGRRFGEEVERVVHLLLEHPEMGARVDESRVRSHLHRSYSAWQP